MGDIDVSNPLLENYADYYSSGASEWRRLGAIGKADNIVELCAHLTPDRVLEIGAGDGSILQRLSEMEFGRHLHAIEISPSGVAAIQKRGIPRLEECQVFDGYRIPYEDDQFDVAVLSHVLEHAEHPRRLLVESARVARYLVVEVPMEDTLRLTGDFHWDAVGHINYYTPTTLRRLAQSCGLRVRRQITTNAPRDTYTYTSGKRGLLQYYLKEATLRISSRIATELFCYHGTILCEKALPPQ
jgi:ubiquinone/menaquinone biosynthesis C-methylase UbiE